MEDVGVRELRQNLSRYLRRVAGGETLRVRERGRAVALLSPVPEGGGVLEQLIAAGRARPASGDLLALGPPPTVPLRMSISEALQIERTER